MKFSFASLAVTIGLVAHALANPTPQVNPDVTYHCGGGTTLVCPPNYRCCGPLVLGVGGTCFKGKTGICPL